jgi:hypothetical protein
MAEIWGMAIAAGATLVGSYMSSSAAGDAADQQAQSAQNSLQLQKQMHDETTANLAPYNLAGQNALAQMQQLNSGNFSSFTQSPDYQFALSQGTKAMDASAAARGNLFAGGYGEQMQQFGQGLASQNYSAYYNRLAGLASQGENSAAQTGYQNANYANAATGINTNAGEAAAQGTLGQASAWNNGLNQLSSAYGQYASSYGGGSGYGGGSSSGSGAPYTGYGPVGSVPGDS